MAKKEIVETVFEREFDDYTDLVANEELKNQLLEILQNPDLVSFTIESGVCRSGYWEERSSYFTITAKVKREETEQEYNMRIKKEKAAIIAAEKKEARLRKQELALYKKLKAKYG